MQALFVHGMGRSPVSAIPMLWRLKRGGITPYWFFYMVTFQKFSSISGRLQRKIIRIASKGEYVLIGHSLGGVLIREAMASLPPGTRLPERVFLLGSPVCPSRIAQLVRRNWLYWLATRDCGQLLASEERMRQVPPCTVPTTSIIGTYSLAGLSRLFGNEENDSIVSWSEVAADWISEEVRVPVSHTFLTSNKLVSKAVVERIQSDRQ
jgi:pimeloyl-ACP methyl ester carboxylesterase